MAKTLQLKSHAKLNWYLRVLDRRPDGYHDIETVFQELALADEMTFTASTEDDCELIGFPPDIEPSSNLVRRAWTLMRELYGTKVGGLRVKITKTIPRGGGLGGGSSNAASTLRAINDLNNLKLNETSLQSIASKLGSDAPFFIGGRTAIGRGRGELLTTLSPVRQQHMVLVFPTVGVSTKDAYSRLSALGCTKPYKPLEPLLEALSSGNTQALSSAVHNDFESVVQNEAWFSNTVSALDHVGCLRAMLCGSGSTIAGLGKNNQHCLEMSRQLRDILPYAHSVTCTLAGSGAS